MSKIKNITCHKTLNSRGTWTIETKVELDDGSVGTQVIPEGASKGENEALYIPVDKAIDVVSSALFEALKDENAFDQVRVDKIMLEMDGTGNKSHLGGNSILSVSLAVAKAAAVSRNLPLYMYLHHLYSGSGKKNEFIFPTPVFNIINGGKHADNNLSFQEFMVISARSMPFDKSYELGVAIYNDLGISLREKGFGTEVGDEGGYAPSGLFAHKALELIRDASKKHYTVGKEVFFGIDAAADSFKQADIYRLDEENLNLSGRQLADFYENLMLDFELIYLEDPFYESDYIAWEYLNKKVENKLIVVSDDLTVTNPSLLKKVVHKGLANAVIVKPNQVGTLTETLEFVKLAKDEKFSVVVSHRSGDSAEDTFISDLSLAVGADFIKSGAPARGERVAKYNRLLDIFYEMKNPEKPIVGV